MTDRIADKFAQARSENRACFVAYLCAGDPCWETSLKACQTLIESGIDVLEIGVPFSDPLADGLTNQLAAQRALESGMTQEHVFNLVRKIRQFSDIPIVFYTYYNLIFSQGEADYIQSAKDAGVDGILTLDLPPEEADSLLQVCREKDMKTIFIVAPTTPAERLKIITKSVTGFVYYVSRTGVTGERDEMANDIGEAVTLIKQYTLCPVVVGFGISKAEHVREIGQVADGVVIGSALVNCIAQNQEREATLIQTLRAKTKELVAGLKE